ncbi:uncharacterized protein UTRI_06680_B [Ustilago trichophora]|uniref:Uncharacterized protein n=1 Tax=Ustilago trichophora TaxID=86804 RepID=A0A5C3EQB4_9BASI|nr:uncharacterized protein UTRI_06680_B [Ustilago trichophora]
MSLRFLTRRRDRDRDRSTNHTSSPSSTCAILPSTSALKAKSPVPAEVQIISWDPKQLEASGREVHIRSRGGDGREDATPVYTAYTPSASASTPGRPSSTILTNNTNSVTTLNHRATSQRPRTAPRTERRAQAWPESFFDSAAPLSAPINADFPRHDHIEELVPSCSTDPTLQSSRTNPIRMLASKARRTRSRSHHSTTHPHQFSPDALPSSSLPSSSRSPFSSIHRNASVQSLVTFISFSAAPSKDHQAEPLPQSASTSLLSRIPSTRKLRRKNNASSADIHFSTTHHPEVKEPTKPNRSRSASLSNMAPKFLRKELPLPPTPSKASVRPRGPPPSAWKADTGNGDVSSYSSDNDAGSSSAGHFDSNASLKQHARQSSADTSILTTHASSIQTSHLLPPPPSSTEITSKRFSAYNSRSPASPVQPLDTFQHHQLQPTTANIESPSVSGLPLPPFNLGNSNSSLPTDQLFKRLGPPPVGLAPSCFMERVSLIQSYILSQVPPAPLPKLSPTSNNSLRLSLPPPPPSSSPPFCSRSITALKDEFDKLECLTEQHMSLTLPPASHVTPLRLEEAFLEARRRCGVDASRSWFSSPSFSEGADFNCANGGGGIGGASGGGGGGGGGIGGGGGGNGGGLGLSGIDRKMESGVGEVSLKPAPRSRRRAGVANGMPARRPITAPETAYDSNGAVTRVGRGAMSFRSNLASDPTFTAARPGTARSTLTQFPSEDHHRCTINNGELFTPQSFSSKPSQPFSLSTTTTTIEHHNSTEKTPYPPSSATTQIRLRRGSSDRDSSSSHTHRSSSSMKSPLFFSHPQFHTNLLVSTSSSYAILSKRRDSQDTLATEEEIGAQIEVEAEGSFVEMVKVAGGV